MTQGLVVTIRWYRKKWKLIGGVEKLSVLLQRQALGGRARFNSLFVHLS